MYKRHFISTLIGTRHYIAIIALLTFIVGSQNVPAQSQLAQDAFAIFEASCLNCHGADGAFRETLLMEHNELIDGGTVVPGNPNASELYKRLLGPTENGVQMPFGQPQLPAQSIDTIRRWILAGAPDWAAAGTPLRRFITPREVLTSIETHLNSLSSFDRSFARYFTMTHLYNAGETAEILREYRNGLSKLVNSLSWRLKITNPQFIDLYETIFYIDLRHYEWDRNDGWTKIEEAYPYHISFDAPAHLATRNQLGRLQTQMKTDVPSVHIDWFIAAASTPPLYHELLSLPLTVQELESRLEVDVARNLRDAPGIEVWRAGINNSGVSNHNRVVERHTSRYGAYWKSYDFAGSAGAQNIFTHPLNFTHDGGEIIFNLPNGLQSYYLVDGNGIRLDEAPISIVSSPAASDPTVRNGISCIGCHTEGMKTVEDQVRSVIESNLNPSYNSPHALRLYVEKSDMDVLVSEDMDRYRVALEKTGGAFSGVEPVSRFHEAFQGPIDAAYAAAVVGLETETFLERIRENTGLQSVGLLALESENGSVKRDAWTSSFRKVISALDYPQRVGEPPVVTQPDVIPGRLVHIPDPKLRAVIEEALETKAITPSVMATLTTLNAKERNISDITGLESAVNLEELNIGENPIFDFSPLSGCVNLVRLFMRGNNPPKTDLSPLANLTKLEILEVQEFRSDDLSFLTRLTNLRELYFYGGPTGGRGIQPVSGLTKLRKLRFKHQNVADISPLANLVHLEWLDLHHNYISDLSPLRNLTKLEFASLGKNRISNIEPLRHLTNLKWLDVTNNQIADFSPLDRLHGKTAFIGVGNPGYPKGGPRIEGPWLWLPIPNRSLEDAFGIDHLSEVSGDTVTEIGVATLGATAGNSVGDEVWTSHKLPIKGRDNIKDMLGLTQLHGVIYGNVSLYSPVEQSTTIHIGAFQRVKIWLNGTLIYQRDRLLGGEENYTEFSPVTLQQGKNVLLIATALHPRNLPSYGFFGFESGTEYTVVSPSIGYAFSEMPIHLGDTFTLDIRAENVFELAGWQFDITFGPAILEAVDVSEGDFLETNGGSTFFQDGRIDNVSGNITGLNAALLSNNGVSSSGTILQVKFKAKSDGETSVALENFLFGSFDGENIPAGPLEIHFTVEERLLTGDVNRDGVVNILDLILVARQLGKKASSDSREDVNGDGVVNIFDLTLVAQGIGGAAAPAVATGRVDAATVEAWIVQARLADDGSTAFRQGIANLQYLLASLIPQETTLLSNYPNPFNPETWIPYRLAAPSEVMLTIYDMNGVPVRRFEMGHQAAGLYQNRSRALHWDGRNGRREPVASGLYFYTLRAGEFTATRKMLIRK